MLNPTKILLTLMLVCGFAAAQTTSTYTLPPSGCVYVNNCIIYGPAESFSLNEIHYQFQPPYGVYTSYSIFNVYSWANGFSVVDTYSCPVGQQYAIALDPAGPPAGGIQAVIVTASCAGVDADGVAFAMSYTINAYSFMHRSGGGKGGGGAGIRWQVTGGSVTITQ
jgi:hypothetical protein